MLISPILSLVSVLIFYLCKILTIKFNYSFGLHTTISHSDQGTYTYYLYVASIQLLATLTKDHTLTICMRCSFLLISVLWRFISSLISSSSTVFSFSTSVSCSSAMDRARFSESALAMASCNWAAKDSLQQHKYYQIKRSKIVQRS